MNSPRESTMAVRHDAGVALLDWLAGLLSAPMSIAAVTACRSRNGAILFDAIADELGFLPGLKAMRAVLNAEETDGQAAVGLSRRYTRLFDGPAGPATVSLYESTYGGLAHRLRQQPMVAMEALLLRSEMGVRAACNEPADHLALEVALLARLLRVDDRTAARELQQQLLNWVPRVAAACALAEPRGFYWGVLVALQGTLMSLRSLPLGRTHHELSG